MDISIFMKRIFLACLFDFLNLDPTEYCMRRRLSLVIAYLTKNMFYSNIVFVTYFVNLQDWRHRICVLKEKKSIDHDIDELKTYERSDILTMFS